MRKRSPAVGVSAVVAATVTALLALPATAATPVGTLGDNNGVMRMWGDNAYGWINPQPGTFATVDTGAYHTVGLRPDGTLHAWGDNGVGQTNVPAGVYKAVATGYYMSFAMRADGTIAAWGDNSYGELNVPAGTYTSMAAGFLHALAIRTDGTLAAWGSNERGELNVPTGTFQAIAGGEHYSLGLRTDGTVSGWGSNDYGVLNVPTGTFQTLTAGSYHAVAIRDDGTLRAWGMNVAGSTNAPSGTFIDVEAGYLHNLAIRTDGSLAAWGWNSMGQSNAPTDGVYVDVTAGYNFSIAMEAQNAYAGDLRIYGKNVTATLNRSVTVGGDLLVESLANLYNNPLSTVAGDAVFAGGGLSGAGIVNVSGDVNLTGDGTLAGGVVLNAAGALAGPGTLTVNNARATVGLTQFSTHTGGLNVGDGGVLRFNGTGEVGASNVTIADGGEVRLDPGQRMVASGGLTNAGDFNVRDAEFEAAGASTNAASTGFIAGHGATLRFRGGLANAGSIAMTGGVNDVYGDVTNTGNVTFTAGATATFYDDFVNNGTLTVRSLGGVVSNAVFLGEFAGAGTVTGGGNVFLEGDLKPGNSPARVNFGANLALGAAVETEIELAGLTSGLYDRLDVTGNLSLDGTLNVALLDGFALAPGQTYTIFSVTGTLSGGFVGLADGALVGTYGGEGLWIDYRSNAVTLHTQAAAVPEPATLGTLAVAGALALRRRRR